MAGPSQLAMPAPPTPRAERGTHLSDKGPFKPQPAQLFGMSEKGRRSWFAFELPDSPFSSLMCLSIKSIDE